MVKRRSGTRLVCNAGGAGVAVLVGRAVGVAVGCVVGVTVGGAVEMMGPPVALPLAGDLLKVLANSTPLPIKITRMMRTRPTIASSFPRRRPGAPGGG